MVEFTPENWISIFSIISGLFIALLSLLFSYYLNKKALNQSERNVRLQITYADRKQALQELENIFATLNNDGLRRFETELNSFLNSVNGQYIPQIIKEHLKNQIIELHKLEDQDPSEPHYSDDYWEELAKQQAEFEEQEYKSLDDYERFWKSWESEIDKFRESTKSKINSEVKKVVDD
ncbi:MAG: hypothetical protein Q7R70_01425 [Candidatus Diapherotrites archaeon]|nr:hypothetical protein [Candidatus Diapherotrites archaeon]